MIWRPVLPPMTGRVFRVGASRALPGMGGLGRCVAGSEKRTTVLLRCSGQSRWLDAGVFQGEIGSFGRYLASGESGSDDPGLFGVVDARRRGRSRQLQVLGGHTQRR